MNAYRILVTGVGAVIGYGVIRSLRKARPESVVIGLDIHPDAVGKHWCDQFERSPLVADPAYPCPGGESHNDVLARMNRVFETVRSARRPVIVTHGTAIRVGATALLKAPV